MSVELSIVIPAYNEEKSLAQVLERTCAVCSGLNVSYEVLVCDDGSSDHTADIAQELSADLPIKLLRQPYNQGVAEAQKRLYREAAGVRVIFLPADGQIDADQIPRLLTPDCPIVIGHRISRQDAPFRLFASWGFNFLVRLLWGIKVYDIDSVVCYRRDVLNTSFSSRDLCLPVEILIKAQKRGLSFTEVMVEHKPRTSGKASGASPLVMARTIASLIKARLTNSWE
ncbi:MAG: glycosyltransferase family 2 protein [bacterium]|nr:glycosyltransferase family 2 protein [bacterium]